MAQSKVREDANVGDDTAPSHDIELHLRLYVAGKTTNAVRAIRNLETVCELHLKGRYQIEIVDLLKNPALAKADQILAVPTLVRLLPPPVRKVIGDLTDTEKVLMGLDIQMINR